MSLNSSNFGWFVTAAEAVIALLPRVGQLGQLCLLACDEPLQILCCLQLFPRQQPYLPVVHIQSAAFLAQLG